MLIDWFTVGAQVVNFLVLVYLLKRFLYHPILRAMDRREQAIDTRLADAEKTRAAAERTAAEYQQQKRQLEEQSDRRLAQAEADAERRRKELIEQAKTEAEGLRQRWSETVGRERARFLGELKKRVGVETLRISRKSTVALTGEDLQPRLAAVLLGKLRGLAIQEKERCAQAAIAASPAVRTPFPLGGALEKEISAGLQEICGSDVPVAYSTDPEMALGIETTIGELKLAWGIDSYFSELEKSVSEQLEQSIRSSSTIARETHAGD